MHTQNYLAEQQLIIQTLCQFLQNQIKFLILYTENMIRTFYNQNERRFAPKTAQQLFRRVDNNQAISRESRVSKSSKQTRNFPLLSESSARKLTRSGKSLDNSKQNLVFESYLQKVNSASKIDEKSIVSNYLNMLRKDYDKMHKQTKEHMSSITLKKKDIDFIKERIKCQHQSVQSLEQKINKKLEQMAKIKDKQQQVETERKTLDYVILRMKKDQIFYKQFGRVFQGHLSDKKKVLKALNQNILLEDQHIHKLIMNIDDMNVEFEKIQEFRERKFQDYCQKLQNIHEKQMFIQERKQRTLQLQSIESNDILKAKNLEMRNICLINKLADSLFQSKIQRMIQSYAPIQTAFHTIQVKTSISDPTLIASKFFSYEELTENLLKSISHYEKKLKEQTKRNKQLREQYKNIEEKTFNNDVLEVKQITEQKLTQEQIAEINAKHLEYKKIIDWINRQAKRLKILTTQSEQQSLEQLAKKFIQVCLKTKTQTAQLSKTFKQPEKYVTPGIRIKKLIRQSHLDFKNQKMKQLQQAQQENVAEDEFLKVARAGVKRNFLIKQKTINMGTLVSVKQTKNQPLISDRARVSDNK